MNAAEQPHSSRGAELLLEHCAALDKVTPARMPAYARLERVLGGRLTRLLVAALAHRLR